MMSITKHHGDLTPEKLLEVISGVGISLINCDIFIRTEYVFIVIVIN